MLMHCVSAKSLQSVTLWTVTHQAPLSMGFSRQEYWSGLPCPPPGDIPNPGMNTGLLHCRRILYHLSQKGSPIFALSAANFHLQVPVFHFIVKEKAA